MLNAIVGLAVVVGGVVVGAAIGATTSARANRARTRWCQRKRGVE